MVQHKEASFFFKVVGMSLSGVSILDGDIVLVDRSVTAVPDALRSDLSFRGSRPSTCVIHVG